MAKPGYGKRSAPERPPSRPGDFGHLPAREAYLASLIDRLCENAAMDAKTLAKAQPLYGQQAVRSALNELGRAGHLRRVRRRVVPGDGSTTGTRWVFQTYWSPTARDDEWWSRLLEDDADDAAPAHVPSAEPPCPEADATPAGTAVPGAPAATERRPASDDSRPSPAYTTLARLGLEDPRLALSSADCAALEPLAAEWLARGVEPDHLTRVLVSGLPEQVHVPRGLLRRRLADKMPPEPPAVLPARGSRALMECTDCRVPGRPEALPGGLCRACRAGGGGGPTDAHRMPPATVHARADQARALLRAPCLSRR